MLKNYRVEVQVTQDFPITVQAHSASEAEEIAKCELPYYVGNPAFGSQDIQVLKIEPI